MFSAPTFPISDADGFSLFGGKQGNHWIASITQYTCTSYYSRPSYFQTRPPLVFIPVFVLVLIVRAGD